MLSKLLPVLLVLLGAGGGIGVGLFLMPPAPADTDATPLAEQAKGGGVAKDYVKMNNQFVVPVIARDRIRSMVILSLSLETMPGMREAVYAREPKLRDAFLRTLFDHANMGGFDGSFTSDERLEPLRVALREVAQREMGQNILDVLIVDIARQDP